MVLAAFADMSFRDATQMINDSMADGSKRYVLKDMAEGWETKVLAMVQEDDMRWSANGIADTGKQWNFVQQGMVQPIDELLATSAIPWATKSRSRSRRNIAATTLGTSSSLLLGRQRLAAHS